jgi:hypothetical protein
MKLSSFVMSSWDVKLSYWAAQLALLLVAAELASIVVAVTQVIAIVVAATKVVVVVVAVKQVIAILAAATKVIVVVVVATQVIAIVVVENEFVVVAVTNPNWKFQSLPRQIQCPASTIGCDNQRSFQVSIHHSLQGTPACFYGGQVLPCPQVL